MKVRLDRIPPSGRSYELTIEPDVLDGERRSGEEREARWVGSATGSVTLEPRRGSLAIAGSVTFRHRQGCARCLEPVEGSETVGFAITKLLKEPPPPPPASALVELTEDTIDEDYLTGEEIDLAEVLFEQIVLETPVRVLCADDCKGLCPGCGVNLNEETCRCETVAVDPRFAVLAALRVTKPEPEREDEG